MTINHASAEPTHYDNSSKNYDAFNEKNSELINQTIEEILKKHKAKTVLDLTCGTGSQVFWLADRGYQVTGSDINAKVLYVAKQKSNDKKTSVCLLEGDMRDIKVGEFDAVITIFNAVGHLTKDDFEVAMRNINSNLEIGGIYIFDIFNLDYLLSDDQITSLTIDWQKKEEGSTIRVVQYSTIDESGILASFTTRICQKKSNIPEITNGAQTLQVYTANQLQDMLSRNGFKIITQCNIDGSAFNQSKSDRILTVARKL